jgi:hypothetical protein
MPDAAPQGQRLGGTRKPAERHLPARLNQACEKGGIGQPITLREHRPVGARRLEPRQDHRLNVEGQGIRAAEAGPALPQFNPARIAQIVQRPHAVRRLRQGLEREAHEGGLADPRHAHQQ